MSHLTKPCLCPVCGTMLDAATNTTGRGPPRPGDLTMCLSCDVLMIFAEDLTVRGLTVEEFKAIDTATLERILRMAAIARALFPAGSLGKPDGTA